MSNRQIVIGWLQSTDYLSELSEYISLPSRSRNKDEVKVSAQFSKKLLESCGLTARMYDTTGNPVVYGESLVGDYPTILIYGHHDVQPEGDLSKWNTPPFEATLVGSKLYGRGTADNKGQHYAQILALRYLQENEPEILKRINVKFILDGDEELGSFSLPEFVTENLSMLETDFVYVSDGPSLTTDTPTIVGGVRGIVSLQITIKHNQEDLHSGNFGGVARSATFDLMKLISSMISDSGEILVEGFHEDVATPTQMETELLDGLHEIFANIIETRELTPAIRPFDRSHAIQNSLWPTININGLLAGGVGDQRRTIIPSEAIASIDCRLVANQDPADIEEKIIAHIKRWSQQQEIEDAVTVEFEHAMAPVPSSLKSEYIDLVIESAKEGYGADPLVVPSLGGSLPIYLFPKYLKKPVFLVPYALPDENNHAPNENLDIPFFESGVATTVALIRNLALSKK
ncbi:MAG: M20/M25/M40 family metallo-hydrolase [Candidatus Kariarchaeaceae archaeon]|jgi:acetylornithine deacetylase/succinyl-diaminopimelate desuccinylase-like protein